RPPDEHVAVAHEVVSGTVPDAGDVEVGTRVQRLDDHRAAELVALDGTEDEHPGGVGDGAPGCGNRRTGRDELDARRRVLVDGSRPREEVLLLDVAVRDGRLDVEAERDEGKVG